MAAFRLAANSLPHDMLNLGPSRLSQCWRSASPMMHR